MKHVLSYLVAERQQLRANGGSAVELEANRKAIAAMEWQLDHALTVTRPSAVSADVVGLVEPRARIAPGSC